MKDPRLIEIELLAAVQQKNLERADWQFGLDSPQIASDPFGPLALVGLVRNDVLVANTLLKQSREWMNNQGGEAEQHARAKAISNIENNIAVNLRITHEGRLRLYRLRDEMLNKDRLRDPFGILWDKRHFLSDLEVRLRLHEFPKPFSLLLLDVDRLKALNTKLGHPRADEVLQGIFQALQDTVRPHDAYRLGGDEAGAILPDVSMDEARKIGDAVRAAVEREFADVLVDADAHTPTVSVGVGTATSKLSANELNELVDKIANRAKETKNSVVADSVLTGDHKL